MLNGAGSRTARTSSRSMRLIVGMFCCGWTGQDGGGAGLANDLLALDGGGTLDLDGGGAERCIRGGAQDEQAVAHAAGQCLRNLVAEGSSDLQTVVSLAGAFQFVSAAGAASCI